MPRSKIKVKLDSDKTLSNIMNNQNNLTMNPNLGNQKESIEEMLNHLPMKKQTRKQTQKQTQRAQIAQTTPQAPNDTAKTKENLILRVLKYQSSKRFGPTLKKDMKINYTRETLNRKTLEQLELILHRIRNFLNSRNLDSVFEHMATTSAIGYEKTVTPFYNIDGFSQILLQNPDFWDCLERWKIERDLPDIPPHLLMLYIVASTTITAHQINGLKMPKPQPKPQPKRELIITDVDDKQPTQPKDTKNKKTEFKVGKDI